jgi:hypothetical protein
VAAVGLAVGCGETTSDTPAVPAVKCDPAPAVTFASEDPAYLPAEVRACAFDVSCAATGASWTYLQSHGGAPGSCLVDWNLNGLDGIACAPNAKDCDEWLACATHGHCPDWCAARGWTPQSPIVWTCDGDEVVVCGDPDRYGVPFEDCAALSMHCAQVGFAASCTDGTSCTQASNPHCEGTRVVGCDFSTHLGLSQECGGDGGSCMPILLSAGCVGPGAHTCDGTSFPPHCDGSLLWLCELGFQMAVDCAAPGRGADCVTDANGSVLGCVVREPECDASTQDTCQGNNFVTCGTDMKLASIDCTSLGFRTCGQKAGRAACVP